jgi:acetyl esterase/lipase
MLRYRTDLGTAMRYSQRILAAALFLALAGVTASAQMTNLPDGVETEIAAMGARLDSSISTRSYALMQPLQAPREDLSAGQDVAYGDDPSRKLDIYARKHRASALVPVVVFVHGGGFTSGDKRNGDNVAAWFAREGMVGISMNYRLAPAVAWPAQSLDIGAAVAWLGANAARYGGDARRIVLIGFSSGGAVVASYLFDQSIVTPRDGVVGGVLISGSGLGYRGVRAVYYGDDPAQAAERQPRAHVRESRLPIFISVSEFDTAGDGAESFELAAALCARDGKCPPFLRLSGHNHITGPSSIDTADERLGRRLLEFVKQVVK